jgi:anti-sigma regulatory factor (Ser/Thr protein kinase)
MEWTFDSGSSAQARTSRSQFMSILHSYGERGSDFDAAETIFGELVGNVVRHAPGPVEVRLQWDSQFPVLTVHDEHESFIPNFSLPRDQFQESGRGLFIVKSLARSVRVRDIEDDGTKVTVVLPVARRATLPVSVLHAERR